MLVSNGRRINLGIFGHTMVERIQKTAFLFPGQGSQYVGMGKDFYTHFKEAREIFNQANEILGFDIASLCFHGKQEELNKTAMCQPAILVTSLAILEVLKRGSAIYGNGCHATAGLSLGEYTAHVAAGSMVFQDALRLVWKRGLFMQEACNANPPAQERRGIPPRDSFAAEGKWSDVTWPLSPFPTGISSG